MARHFSKPLARTREYISIIRQVLAREEPVANDGEHYPLPYTGEGSWGLGKPLKPITHPLRADLPIMMGAEGQKTLPWLQRSPTAGYPCITRRFARTFILLHCPMPADFEVTQGVVVNITDDVEAGLIPIKHMLALYVGGMGAKDRFHKELVSRMGFEADAEKIQELYLAGKKQEAAEAVPAR